MLSISSCEKVLKKSEENHETIYTKDKIEAIRDSVYLLANLAYEAHQENQRKALVLIKK